MTTNTATENQERLAQLGTDWLNAKAAEGAANADRIGIELQIIAITGKKADGQQTVAAGDNKITIKTNWKLSLDLIKWDAIASTIPAERHPIKITRTADPAGVKWLRENDADNYARLAEALTITEAKATVEVKIPAAK